MGESQGLNKDLGFPHPEMEDGVVWEVTNASHVKGYSEVMKWVEHTK